MCESFHCHTELFLHLQSLIREHDHYLIVGPIIIKFSSLPYAEFNIEPYRKLQVEDE